jgi:hypothetical protein
LPGCFRLSTSVQTETRYGTAAVACREIEFEDLDRVVDLLWTGFGGRRDRSFWRQAVERLAERTPPAGYPRFGYVLESKGGSSGRCR